MFLCNYFFIKAIFSSYSKSAMILIFSLFEGTLLGWEIRSAAVQIYIPLLIHLEDSFKTYSKWSRPNLETSPIVSQMGRRCICSRNRDYLENNFRAIQRTLYNTFWAASKLSDWRILNHFDGQIFQPHSWSTPRRADWTSSQVIASQF